jgi:hypothetical protein
METASRRDISWHDLTGLLFFTSVFVFLICGALFLISRFRGEATRSGSPTPMSVAGGAWFVLASMAYITYAVTRQDPLWGRVTAYAFWHFALLGLVCGALAFIWRTSPNVPPIPVRRLARTAGTLFLCASLDFVALVPLRQDQVWGRVADYFFWVFALAFGACGAWIVIRLIRVAVR